MSCIPAKIIALAALLAPFALGQGTAACTLNAGVPNMARAEGVSEEVSQIVISCTGGTPTPANTNIPAINIQIQLNTNVTSRLLDQTGNRSEALLLIDEPAPAEQLEAAAVPNVTNFAATGTGVYKNGVHPTVFGAQQATTDKLFWFNIPFDPPGNGKTRVYRIVNVRANASQLGVSSGPNPNSITAMLTFTGLTAPTINSPQVTVAFIQTGLKYSATSATYNQCDPGTKSYTISFAELFGTAFRHRKPAGNQNTPTTKYDTESMFYSSAFTGIGAGAGVATQGTRLSARFTNVPANVTITVPASATSTGGDTASLVATGTDGSTANASTGVVALTGGAGAAVWEVTASNPTAISTLAFTVSVKYAASPVPGLGTATIAGNYAPVAAALVASTEAAPRFIESPNSASNFSLIACGGSLSFSLNRTALALASTPNGSAATPPQEVLITMAGATTGWTASSNSAWLGVSPASGSGSGKFTLAVVPASLPAPGTYTGKATVTVAGATNSPQVVDVSLTVKSSTAAPFGSFDTPANDTAGVAGAIAVTGWALDDIGVKQVTIWRDRVGSEPVSANGFVYIGDSLFVPGARPDVETKYPTLPNANRGGWGYMLLTNMLPVNGNGTIRLHAIAVDEEGNQPQLGSKTIVIDNLHSVNPFGAIDSPGPGQVVSGTINNDGWALTPQPAAIALNGLGIWVNIDGVDVGHPVYGSPRGDISTLFPGYANTNSSAGRYALNTTNYTNGMHSIAWNVYDNQGHPAGIGSRYFYIQNTAAAATAEPAQPAESIAAERTLQLRTARLARFTLPPDAYPAFRQGHDANARLRPIRQAGDGLLEPIEVEELGRMELHLAPGQDWTGALRVGDQLRDLPVGSTFDAEGSIFYWQLAPAFVGEYTLEFRSSNGAVLPVTVRVGGTIQVN